MKSAICILMILGLLAMMVCPALAAVQATETKSSDHCSPEKQPKPQNQTMHGCCDQNAVSVQKVHAPCEMSALQILDPIVLISGPVLFPCDCNYHPYQETGDHLSKLSILRL